MKIIIKYFIVLSLISSYAFSSDFEELIDEPFSAKVPLLKHAQTGVDLDNLNNESLNITAVSSDLSSILQAENQQKLKEFNQRLIEATIKQPEALLDETESQPTTTQEQLTLNKSKASPQTTELPEWSFFTNLKEVSLDQLQQILERSKKTLHEVEMNSIRIKENGIEIKELYRRACELDIRVKNRLARSQAQDSCNM